MTSRTKATRLYTVGHSTRTAEAFVELLRANGIELVVDVRRFPGSRRNPQFGGEALERTLAQHALAYRHEPDLGGRRAPVTGSPNDAWRNPQFRGYADHMSSAAFEAALERVLALARERPVAVMCAEAHPSRCHRRLIADAAFARGVEIVHAIEPGRSEPHVLHPAAHVDAGTHVTYPAKSKRAATGQGELGFAG